MYDIIYIIFYIDTEKKLDIGQSSLPINPIVYPVNSYHYDYQRLKNPNWKAYKINNSMSSY